MAVKKNSKRHPFIRNFIEPADYDEPPTNRQEANYNNNNLCHTDADFACNYLVDKPMIEVPPNLLNDIGDAPQPSAVARGAKKARDKSKRLGRATH